jgi:hypothetical protein
MPTIPWLLLLLLMPALAQEPVPPPTTPPAEVVRATPIRFAFHWPEAGRVRVTKDGVKRSDAAVMDYLLEWTPRDGGGLRLRHSDFQFRSVNGIDATTPARQQELAPLLLIASVVPELQVDARGLAVAVGELAPMIAMVDAKIAAEENEATRTALTKLIAAMRSPIAEEAGKSGLMDDWSTWVGAWAGDLPEVEAQLQSEGQLVHLGARLPATVTLQNHGSAEGHPGHVRLTRVALAEGEAAKAAFGEFFAAKMAEAGQQFDPAGVLEVSVKLTYQVVTDPKTLRPLTAKRTRLGQLRMKGRKVPTIDETSTFTFAW